MDESKTLFCYCYIEGEIQRSSDDEILTNREGDIIYRKGRVNALPISDNTRLDDFISSMGEMLNVSMSNKSIRYTSSAARNILLPLSNDNDLRNMIRFNERIAKVYIFEDVEGTTIRNSCPTRLEEDTRCGTPYIDGSQTLIEAGEVGTTEMVELDMPGIASGQRAELCSSLYENCIADDQLFNSVDSFREAVHKFSVAHHFAYKWVRNTATYLDVRCRVDGCKWRITARRVKDTSYIKVREFVNEHQHDAQDHLDLDVQPLVRTTYIATMFESTIKQTPNYLPCQIAKDMHQDYALQVKYNQSWQCKKRAVKNILGDVADSYSLVPWMCNRFVEEMPGSVAICNIADGNGFHQLFIAYRCSLDGFRVGCRPMLFVDGTYLSGPNKGTLISATAIDANNAIYPVAYGVVSSENHVDWLWFFQTLKSAIDDPREIIIVSDKHPSIIEGARAVFGSHNHAFCLRHLKENFSSWLSGKGLIRKDARDVALSLFTAVAKARLPEDFDERLKELDGIHPECSTWLHNSSPQYWANLFFPKRRWDIMSSNIADTYSEWIRNERHLPILSLIEETRVKLGELLRRRHEEASSWNEMVGPTIANEVKKNVDLGRGGIVRKYNSSFYEIETIQGKKIGVHLASKTCTCRKWEMTGIPCEHACQAIERAKLNIYQFVDPCYHKDTQLSIYSSVMQLVPNIDMPVIDHHNMEGDDSVQPPIIGPPNTKHKVGRPKRKCIESQSMDKRTVHCQVCHKPGHNRKSCKEAI